jgi:hypothetical protein
MKRPSLKSLTAVTSALLCLAAVVVLNAQTPNKKIPPSDVKIRQRMTSGNSPGMETVLYIKGPRMRNEMAGSMGMTTILQCDLKRTLTINEKTRTYLVTPTDGTNGPASDGGAGAPTAANQPPTSPERGGVVNITHTMTDTGERKEMFGFTASHIKTSTVRTTSPDACDKDAKVETDGWYIDFQYSFDCSTQSQKYVPPPVRPQPGCKDEIRTKTIGTAKLGFPLLVTTTIYMPDGRTTSMTQEVLELSREPLAASFFELPDGYSLAADMQQLYGMGSPSSSTASNSQPGNTSGSSSSAVSTPAGNSAAVTAGSTPKKQGVIRIGLLLPSVQMSSGNPAQAAEAVRNTFASYLTGPTIEVVPLTARLPALAMDEARQSQCDYVLSSSMTVKKGGAGGSMFGRAIGNIAGSAAGHIPGGGSAATGAARSTLITGVYTTAAIASSIKAKDEVKLDYNLQPINSTSAPLSNTAKTKASHDGEDVVEGLVQRAATAVVSAIAKP